MEFLLFDQYFLFISLCTEVIIQLTEMNMIPGTVIIRKLLVQSQKREPREQNIIICLPPTSRLSLVFFFVGLVWGVLNNYSTIDLHRGIEMGIIRIAIPKFHCYTKYHQRVECIDLWSSDLEKTHRCHSAKLRLLLWISTTPLIILPPSFVDVGR